MYPRSSYSLLAVGYSASPGILAGDISLGIQIGSVQLLVESGSGACQCASLFVGCGAVVGLPHNHLTTLLPALERSPKLCHAKIGIIIRFIGGFS